MFIGEAHTINDWLSGKTPGEYAESLASLIKLMKGAADRVIMLTVSPILGGMCKGPIAGFKGPAAEYEELIKESYRVIESEGVSLADGHKLVRDACGDMNEEELYKELYSDRWHLNTKRHKLYADAVIGVLKNEIKE